MTYEPCSFTQTASLNYLHQHPPLVHLFRPCGHLLEMANAHLWQMTQYVKTFFHSFFLRLINVNCEACGTIITLPFDGY